MRFSHGYIAPVRYTTTVILKLEDFKKFKEKTNEKINKFYIHKKRVVDNWVYLEIRSLRVNEFCQLLTDWGIIWEAQRSNKDLYNNI